MIVMDLLLRAESRAPRRWSVRSKRLLSTRAIASQDATISAKHTERGFVAAGVGLQNQGQQKPKREIFAEKRSGRGT
jgi:hypothetical protein